MTMTITILENLEKLENHWFIATAYFTFLAQSRNIYLPWGADSSYVVRDECLLRDLSGYVKKRHNKAWYQAVNMYIKFV